VKYTLLKLCGSYDVIILKSLYSETSINRFRQGSENISFSEYTKLTAECTGIVAKKSSFMVPQTGCHFCDTYAISYEYKQGYTHYSNTLNALQYNINIENMSQCYQDIFQK
jgi:hypothetical protein